MVSSSISSCFVWCCWWWLSSRCGVFGLVMLGAWRWLVVSFLFGSVKSSSYSSMFLSVLMVSSWILASGECLVSGLLSIIAGGLSEFCFAYGFCVKLLIFVLAVKFLAGELEFDLLIEAAIFEDGAEIALTFPEFWLFDRGWRGVLAACLVLWIETLPTAGPVSFFFYAMTGPLSACLLYTSDAADE